MMAGAGLSPGQQLAGEPPGRIPPVEELINVFEVEAIAQRKLGGALYAEVAGGDRKAFDRITFRPRMMTNTVDLDLSVELFGQKLFAPILGGPVPRQSRFHPEGELAMAEGASAAKTAMVVAADSSHPFEKIAARTTAPLWYQVAPEADMSAVRARVQEAARTGCKAVCLTLGGTEAGADWSAIDRLREGIGMPMLLKGIMSAEEARAAMQHGVAGIIVSNYRQQGDSGLAASIEVLPSITEAVGGKIPVLVDGSFRRGTDVLKALALGARAVLVARPVLWGLAAYGAPGVKHVLDLMQGELARNMAMCGTVNLAAIHRGIVRIHRW
jgi:4-hydroxymandelate oxidase